VQLLYVHTRVLLLYCYMERVHQALQVETREWFKRLDNLRKDVADTTLEKEAKKVPVLSRRPINCRRTLRGHFAKVHDLSWSKDSRTLVTASQDGKILLWDAYTGHKENLIHAECKWMMSCDMSPLGRLVIAGGLDCLCTIYQVAGDSEQQCIRQRLDHNNFIACCQFMDEGTILTSTGDGIAYMWDLVTNTAVTEYKGHTDALLCQAISPDKNLFVTAGCDQMAKVWDTRMKDSVQTFYGHSKDISDVAFFPSGTAFATASEDHSCRLFDLRSDQQLMTYKTNAAKSPVTCTVFSLSGRLLFAGYEDSEIRLWDTLKGTLVGFLVGHTCPVSSLAVTPDGKGLASSSYDTSVKIWN